MESVFLVFKTDANHSYNSRDLIAIGTSKLLAISLVKQQAKKEGEKLSTDCLWQIDNINQTQGYSGVGEFVIEENELNKLF